MRRRWAAALALAAFVLGVGTGVVADRRVLKKRIEAAVKDPAAIQITSCWNPEGSPSPAASDFRRRWMVQARPRPMAPTARAAESLRCLRTRSPMTAAAASGAKRTA